ncbi:MAG: hypothetical protein ACI92I_000779 [Acidimicrobiales bacterium]|jgi:hypothetical protein
MSVLGFCLTVTTKTEGCGTLVFMEEELFSETLIEVVTHALSSEYRKMNDVKSWCFHRDNKTPYPGDLKQCNECSQEQWLMVQASKAFGWELK